MDATDHYCERSDLGLWAEPLNAATNAAILVAAWLVWRYMRRTGEPAAGIVLLIALMIAFGLGSTLFHTLPNATTLMLDALPIGLFVLVYVWLYLYRVLNVSLTIAVVSTLAFAVAAEGVKQFSGVFNGSIIYAPALIVVTGLGLLHAAERRRERWALIGAASVLIVALFFRTIDNAVCAAFPIGTHFLWHLVGALALYLAMRALIANMAATDQSKAAPDAA